MLCKTESWGVTHIETDVRRYNQTGSEFRVPNINVRAMLLDSTVSDGLSETKMHQDHFSTGKIVKYVLENAKNCLHASTYYLQLISKKNPKNKKSQFYPRLPQKKSLPLSTSLQEECLPGPRPLKAWVWEQCDIDRLDRVQRSAARFITGDYKSRQEGCVTKMLTDLGLPPLEVRLPEQRLALLYKVVKGHVPYWLTISNTI